MRVFCVGAFVFCVFVVFAGSFSGTWGVVREWNLALLSRVKLAFWVPRAVSGVLRVLGIGVWGSPNPTK